MAALSATLAKLGSLLKLDSASRILLPATPPQFDNSLLAATTAFVQRALGNFQSWYYYSASQTLTAAQIGSVIEIGVGGTTLTLPALSSVPVGACFVLNSIATTPVTVAPAGSDTIDGLGTVGNATSFPLYYNDMVWVVSLGSKWHAMGSGAAMFSNSQSNGMFGASLASAGYQKLPSGWIAQWGTVTSNSSGLASGSLPIAFPTTQLIGFGTFLNGSGVFGSPTLTSLTLTGIAFQLASGSGAPVNGGTVNYLAFGK